MTSVFARSFVHSFVVVVGKSGRFDDRLVRLRGEFPF